MNHRIRDVRLMGRIESAEIAADIIQNGMTVAMSGYAMAGYPKAVVKELVRRKQSGEHLTIGLITGANVPWLDETLGNEQMISTRAPMVASRVLSSQANSGAVRYIEQQMNRMPRLLRNGSFGKIDVAVIEALGFDEDGSLIPTTSVGMTHYLMDAAEHIIVEINTAQPEALWGLHDIYAPAPPPHTQPIPIVSVGQRIGRTGIPMNLEKLRHIVVSDIAEVSGTKTKITPESARIADHLFNFLELEISKNHNRILPPIQTGFGGIADAIATAFEHSSFNDLQFFCGGVGGAVMELLASGKAKALSAGGLEMNGRVESILKDTPDVRNRLVLRSGDVTNNAEVIGRLGLIALNSGIEMDIYGNVNSSHISGTHVVNGIGGGANFAQNAGLSVVLLPSVGRKGAVSNIVPMVSHQDICEHDVDIVITEHGVADLRGKDDIERAAAIVKNCTDGVYREQLDRYFDTARLKCGGHHPQLPQQAFAWYDRLAVYGTMQETL